MHWPRLIMLTGLAFLLLASAATIAQPAEQVEAELAELRELIEQINQALIEQREQQQQEQAALAETERELGLITREIRETDAQLEQVRARVSTLSAQSDGLQDEINQQRERLGEQLRMAYRLGVQSRVRAMLSGDDPNRVARKLALHGYLGRARLEAVDTLNQQVERLDQLLDEQRRNRARLNQLQRQQSNQLAQQQLARADREQALTELERAIVSDEQTLANLKLDAERLEQLLEELTDVLADIAPQIESVPFPQLRGELPMPVNGRLRARYGDVRSGDVRWDGWLIQAEIGQEVSAIAYGRVAYSDWLRGYGLILIIDHGDGFMSLYGHNQA
ncbi:MAG: peptidoglycan DD-metalloendopeptidase family protein, partial [Pseudomonadota bacterium]